MTTFPEPQQSGTARAAPPPGVSYEVLSLPEIPKTVIQAKSEDAAKVQSRIPSPIQPKPEDIKMIQERLGEQQDSRLQNKSSRVMSPPRRVMSPESRVMSPPSRVMSPESRVMSPESRV